VFKEVVRSNLNSINQADNEGNSCIHFAAGAGASLDQLTILQRAGAEVTCTNYSGQTLLHVLDPKVYGRTLPVVLSWASSLCLSFFQRDCHGQTPLHHILGRNITLTTVHDLMPFLEAAGRSMTFLDRNGNTPLDVLRDNWQRANHGVHLSQLDAKLIAYNIPIAYRKLPTSGSKFSAPLPDMGKLAITGRDEISDDILNIITRSQYEPYYQDSRSQNVLHALAAFSFHANYQNSCYMTPWDLLQCLQRRLDNSPNIGVDINQYNSDGFTPLHCFLNATFDINSDISWLVPECVELLLQHGADPTLRDRHGNTALHLACSRARFDCAGQIYLHLSSRCVRQQYIQCLSAVNDHGKTVVEEAESSMSSETLEANERRKQCIGLVRAALGEPMYSYMPAAYQSAASSSMILSPSPNTWSAQLPNHGRKSSTSSAGLGLGHRKNPSWPSRTSSLKEPQVEIKSAFED
jgi:ankyrin repeat protein